MTQGFTQQLLEIHRNLFTLLIDLAGPTTAMPMYAYKKLGFAS
jgi:hypothetical protein